MSTKKPSHEKISNVPPFGLRMLPELRDRLKNVADMLGRSLNAEIVERLRVSLDEEAEDILKISLPAEVRNLLEIDSLVHRVSTQERIAQLLTGIFDKNHDYALALDEVIHLTGEREDLSELNRYLSERLDLDFLSYFGKVIQLKQFADAVLREGGENIPSQIKSAASDLLAISESELIVLRSRNEEILYRKKMREKIAAAEQAENSE